MFVIVYKYKDKDFSQRTRFTVHLFYEYDFRKITHVFKNNGFSPPDYHSRRGCLSGKPYSLPKAFLFIFAKSINQIIIHVDSRP